MRSWDRREKKGAIKMADRYRHSNGRYRIHSRPLILALALVLRAGLGVGATLGLLHTRT